MVIEKRISDLIFLLFNSFLKKNKNLNLLNFNAVQFQNKLIQYFLAVKYIAIPCPLNFGAICNSFIEKNMKIQGDSNTCCNCHHFESDSYCKIYNSERQLYLKYLKYLKLYIQGLIILGVK